MLTLASLQLGGDNIWVWSWTVSRSQITLTKAPKPLSKREKHAAQAIKHMWVKDGEALDNSLHTHNRYGTQLGDKVPLWAGFTGGGKKKKKGKKGGKKKK